MAASRPFRDRTQAGRALAARLGTLDLPDPVVLALPRGGVPVGYEVARALRAPLDLIGAHKIGAPGNPELAIGAVAEGGVRVLSPELVRELLLSPEELTHAVEAAAAQLDEAMELHRRTAPAIPLEGRTAILVDDGLATGATAHAAITAIRARRPRRVILAVPVASIDALDALRDEVDELMCVEAPRWFGSVGSWYERFDQVSDAEVDALLTRAAGREPAPAPAGAGAAPPQAPVALHAGIPVAPGTAIAGDLAVPAGARGLVVLAHGSGGSRHSPRNRHVAALLEARGLATLLLDLLTADEELDRRNVFDVPLLARRLLAAVAWARREPAVAELPVACFGAGTGAAAALWAAAEEPRVRTVVSRSGRPDLAAERLSAVAVPVLLIVGGRDPVVLDLNREAMERLPGACELAVISEATHLFEEPGALDEVARLAGDWILRHLA